MHLDMYQINDKIEHDIMTCIPGIKKMKNKQKI